MTASPGIEDVRRDPFCLDHFDARALERRPSVIVTNKAFPPLLPEVPVKHVGIPPWRALRRACAPIPLARSLMSWVEAFAVAARLVAEMRRPGAVGLVALGDRSGSLFCFLNSFRWLRGGAVLAYQVHMLARAGRLKTHLIGRALRSVNLIAVWSRAQIENYHRVFGIPRDKLVFLPYKANHSQSPSTPMPAGGYLFSGGNSERDYGTLFEAARGLDIPVIVSTTKPEILRGLAVPENVILVSTEKQAFERLMAGARVVALCVREGIIRGAGEATLLNAMWHGKPVVAADNVSAPDYIRDGVDGFVMPAGSAEQMRRRILELWRNPGLAARMGEAARAKVAGLYTHRQHKFRLEALAMLVFARDGR